MKYYNAGECTTSRGSNDPVTHEEWYLLNGPTPEEMESAEWILKQWRDKERRLLKERGRQRRNPHRKGFGWMKGI